MVGFIFGGNTGETSESLARRREYVRRMMQQAGSNSPRNVGEGLAAIGQALSARFAYNALQKDEAKNTQYNSGLRDSLLSGMASNVAPVPTPTGGADASGGLSNYRDAIASIESAGSGDYSAVGPTNSKLGRALGRYQVMEANIGPWSEAALGRRVSADEFLSTPAIQDAVFDHRFGSYVQKYGNPQDAASMWFTGKPAAEGANRRDVLGTTGSAYVSKFSKALGQGGGGAQPAPVQVASLDPSIGMPSSFNPYANIPARDTRGEDQQAKFRQWNSNPQANEAAGLSAIDPALSGLINRAREISGQPFVLGSGLRSPEQQKLAMAWGWSGTEDSDHLGGGAADLWPVDANGQVVFDPAKQRAVASAMSQAAKERGIDLDVGANWKKPDLPHFAISNQTPMNAPTPTARPEQMASLLRPFKAGEERPNSDGSYSTEISTTWQTPDGQWVNVPSLWMGPNGPQQFSPDDEEGILGAMQSYEKDNGPTFARFGSEQEAVRAAEARSAAGGAGAGAQTDGEVALPEVVVPGEQRKSSIRAAITGEPDPWASMRQASAASSFPPAPLAGQNVQMAQNGPSLETLYRVYTDPMADEQTRNLAGSLIERRQSLEDEQRKLQMQQNDPSRQLDMRYKQAQIDALQSKAAKGEDETFFGNPIAIQTPNGIQYGQIGNRGGFKPIDIGAGNSFAPNTRTVDTGTELLTVGPGGEILDRVVKNNRQEAAETEAGRVEGKIGAEQAASAPSDYQAAQNALDLIKDIRKDPNRTWATGKSSWLGSIYGTGSYDFKQKVEQAKSGAFLTAIQQMKGMGALSNAEGAAATAAITRMNTTLSEEGFLDALTDYETIVTQAKDRAAKRLPEASGGATGGVARPTSDDEYNALPSGSLFIDPDDGKQYRKP